MFAPNNYETTARSAEGVLRIIIAYNDGGAVIFGQVIKVRSLASTSARRESDNKAEGEGQTMGKGSERRIGSAQTPSTGSG